LSTGSAARFGVTLQVLLHRVEQVDEQSYPHYVHLIHKLMGLIHTINEKVRSEHASPRTFKSAYDGAMF